MAKKKQSIVGDHWDTIYVIPPYANTKFLDDIEADNLWDVESKLEIATAKESAVHLVLINKRKIKSYGELSAGVLDLTHLVHSDGSFFIITRNHCEKFFVDFKKHYPDTWRVDQDKLN